MQEALVEDALLTAENDVNGDGDGVVQCDSDEKDGVVAALPAESDIRTFFKAIEEVAIHSAVGDEVLHLRRATSTLLNTKGRERGMDLRHTLIAEVL